jgi:hypothetical protein
MFPGWAGPGMYHFRDGSLMYVMLQRGDPHYPVYWGGALSKAAELPDILKEDYPFRYGWKDRMGNIFYVNAKEGKNEFWVFHKSGTNLRVRNDGSVVGHIVSTCDMEIDRKTTIVVHDDVDVTIDKNYKGLIKENSDVTIRGNSTLYVMGNVDIRVDGNVTAEVGKDLSAHVQGNASATIEGDFDAKVNKTLTAKVAQDASVTVDGNVNVRGKQTVTVKADGSLVLQGQTVSIQASTVLSLTAGASMGFAAPSFGFAGLSGGSAPTIDFTGGNMNFNLSGQLTAFATSLISFQSSGNYAMSAVGQLGLAAAGQMDFTTNGVMNLTAGGQMTLTDVDGTFSPHP